MNTLDQMIRQISGIVKIQSDEQPAEAGMPFGKGAREALDYFLALANSFGFETKDYDGYCGEVIWGEGEEFAILAHLDVVPAGSGWTHDPYGGEIDEVNHRVWGRGTMDDKGPAIITLFAMKALKEEGFVPKKKIKFIVGCNEETGWGCIDHYNKVATMPEQGFSPDADFPVIYAEKGILHLNFTFEGNYSFSGLVGGGASNMVCDYCEAIAPANEELLQQFGMTAEGEKLVARGKSAHGSTPDAGVNAIAKMVQYLGLTELYQLLFVEKCGLKDYEDVTGKLTFSPNVIRQEGNKIMVTCDMRYPATYKKEDILQVVKSCGVPFEVLHAQAPLYNDKECFLIQTLSDVYNEVSGKKMQPIAIGGGTYARALKCGAGFGPEEEGEENVIHQPNEYITFEKIERCYKIYKLAIERLTK